MAKDVDTTKAIGTKGAKTIISKLVEIGIGKEKIRELPNEEFKNGDLEFNINGEYYYAEAKTTMSSSGSLNQIRACSNLFIIIKHIDCFYLVTPLNVNKYVSLKKRGQHNNDKYGSVHMSCNKKIIEQYGFVDITDWSNCLTKFIKWVKQNSIPNKKRHEIMQKFDELDEKNNQIKEQILMEYGLL